MARMLYTKEARRINLYVTPNCNYDCEYCVIHDNSLKYDKFDYVAWKQLIKDYKHDIEETIEIHIYGGEPLTCPEIYDIIRFFNNQYKVEVLLLTNGALLDKDKMKDLRYNMIISYHPDSISFKNFISNILPFSKNIASVSFMFNNTEIEKAIQQYSLLQRMIPDIDTVFWPAINPYSRDEGHSNSINSITDEFADEMMKKDENFFRVNNKGQSTYHVWRDHGLFVDRKSTIKALGSDETKCTYMGRDIIEVYNNRIFRCSADLHLTIGVNNSYDAPHITKYKEFRKDLNDICWECTQKTCISFDYNYMIGEIR